MIKYRNRMFYFVVPNPRCYFSIFNGVLLGKYIAKTNNAPCLVHHYKVNKTVCITAVQL